MAKPRSCIGKWLSGLALRFDRVFLFPGSDDVDQNFVPGGGDAFEWRAHTAFVSELDKLPARHLEQGVASASGVGFGVHDLAAAKKHEPAPCFFHQLKRAVATTETTHLQNVRDVEKI